MKFLLLNSFSPVHDDNDDNDDRRKNFKIETNKSRRVIQ